MILPTITPEDLVASVNDIIQETAELQHDLLKLSARLDQFSKALVDLTEVLKQETDEYQRAQ